VLVVVDLAMGFGDDGGLWWLGGLGIMFALVGRELAMLR
jgi:hypothetical protein